MSIDKRTVWVLGAVFGAMFLCLAGSGLLVSMMVGSSGRSRLTGTKRPPVGVIEVKGLISDSKEVLEDIDQFRQRKDLKAVVIRVDSPGGGVGASQEIYEAIKRLREKKKVVTSMGGTAASGGLYVAVAGEKVFANPGTVTGSIGVIMQSPNVQGLMKKVGVEMQTVAAGKFKETLSPFSEMTPDERAYLEGVARDVHEQFIQAVADGRGLKVEEVRPYADGRILTGRAAKDLRLVDELGGLDQAVLAAAALAGIEGEPEVEYPRREKGLVRELFGETAGALGAGVVEKLTGPWEGGSSTGGRCQAATNASGGSHRDEEPAG